MEEGTVCQNLLRRKGLFQMSMLSSSLREWLTFLRDDDFFPSLPLRSIFTDVLVLYCSCVVCPDRKDERGPQFIGKLGGLLHPLFVLCARVCPQGGKYFYDQTGFKTFCGSPCGIISHIWLDLGLFRCLLFSVHTVMCVVGPGSWMLLLWEPLPPHHPCEWLNVLFPPNAYAEI